MKRGTLILLVLTSMVLVADAAPPEEAWSKIAPYFSPPAEFAGKLGEHRSPLKFEDGSVVRDAKDWPRRRAEILAKWNAVMGPWPELIERPKVEVQSSEAREGYTEQAVKVEVAPGQMLAGILLVVDGVALALTLSTPVTLDAPRHSIAVGFIALLLAGVSVRMIPGFSGGNIRSPRLVTALLWLGNGAALLRVGSLLAQPLLASTNIGSALDSALFGLSGPLGLTFALALAITLWPALPLARQPAGV